jgi:hypothetical protein
MDVKQIIKEIETLPQEDRMEIYLHLASKIKRREEVLAILEKYKGKAEGVWEMDAQEYVNQLRANDRF